MVVAREFQSYTSKRSDDFVNAVNVVDAAEQPGRGTRCREAKIKKNKKIHCRGGFRVVIQWKLSKMPPPGRRVAAPENPLRRRISLCHSVETDDQDAAAAWKEGNKMPQPRRLEEENNKGYQSDQIHCGGGARGIIVASEVFATLPIYVFVRSSFSPLGFFLPSALPGIFVYIYIIYMFNVIGCLPNGCCSS